MKIHYFEHVAYEGLDRIAAWTQARHHQMSVTRFHAGDALPSVQSYDALIVMGGPMGVYEADRYPWMKPEIAAIAAAIHAGKPVLGICLGSQLIAAALGAKVYPHTEKEIGWWPVEFLPKAAESPLRVFGSQATMFHWHGDTFDLPSGAELLASSAACRHQAYRWKEHVLALQCHPEVSAETITRWVQEAGGLKDRGPFVMTETEMMRQAPHVLPALEKSLFAMLDYFFTAKAVPTHA